MGLFDRNPEGGALVAPAAQSSGGGGGGGGITWSTPVDANIVPDGDFTRNLGAANFMFAQAFIDEITNSSGNEYVSLDGGVELFSNSGNVQLTTNNNIVFNPQGNVTSIASIIPSADDTYSIGQSGARFYGEFSYLACPYFEAVDAAGNYYGQIKANDTIEGLTADMSVVAYALPTEYPTTYGLLLSSYADSLYKTVDRPDANTPFIEVRTGNATAGSFNSGGISLLVGTATATQGDIRFHKLGTTVTVGHVWTATSADGKGYWAAAGGGGANTTLSNLTATVSFNQDLLPDVNNARAIGSTSKVWDAIYTDTYAIHNGTRLIGTIKRRGSTGAIGGIATTNEDLEIEVSNTTPIANAVYKTANASVATGHNIISTGDATTAGNSGNLYLFTGDSTAVNSGDIRLKTGSAPIGIRGSVNVDATSLSVVCDILPTTANSRSLGSNSLSFNRAWLKDIVFKESGGSLYGLIQGAASATTLPSGNTTNMYMADASATSGGNLAVYGLNNSSVSGTGHGVYIETGNGIGTTGSFATGPILIKTGNSQTTDPGGASGSITLQTGTMSGAGARGNILLNANDVVVTAAGALRGSNVSQNLGTGTIPWNNFYVQSIVGKDISGTDKMFIRFDSAQTIPSGATSATQNIQIANSSGTAPFTIYTGNLSSTNSSTPIRIESGNNAGAASAPTGLIALKTGNTTNAGASGATGAVDILTGNHSGSGNSGSITLQTGTVVGGTRGGIILNGLSVTVHSNILANAANSYDIGSSAAPFQSLYAQNIRFRQGGVEHGQINYSSATPSGVGSVLSFFGGATAKDIAVYTQDGTTSGAAFLETGNASSGASGQINIQTGTSSGGAGGDVNIFTGTGTVGSGSIVMVTGNASGTAYTGDYALSSGAKGSGASGNTGNGDVSTGDNLGTGDTGEVWIHSGNASSGNSGRIVLETGTASGTKGNIELEGGRIDCSGSNLPLRVPNLSADPGSPLNGDIWYNTTSNELKARVNGTTVVLA